MKNLHIAKDTTLEPLISSAQPPQGQPQGGRPQMGGKPSTGQAPQGQSPQGQAQGASSLKINLAKYSLPSGPVTDADMPKIKAVIDGACTELNESIKSAGQKVDNEVIKSGLLGFQNWLKRQGCVSQASTRYDIESTDKYSSQIFETYPGTLAFDIDFKMAGNTKKPYRLLLFVSKVDLFAQASLVENKSLAGVPVPKGWPKNPWSFWTERP
jgi:hypothetical protein